jgi:acyl carrier protein phosphodiesterase
MSIAPLLTYSPTRPFFVAHIALELILDSLLLTTAKLDSDRFYTHLQNVSANSLISFLNINKIENTDRFLKFLDEFIRSKYLDSYRDPTQIIYALNRICMRVWDIPFNDTQKLQLMAVITDYRDKLQGTFMEIFEDIEGRLAE